MQQRRERNDCLCVSIIHFNVSQMKLFLYQRKKLLLQSCDFDQNNNRELVFLTSNFIRLSVISAVPVNGIERNNRGMGGGGVMYFASDIICGGTGRQGVTHLPTARPAKYILFPTPVLPHTPN